jgi:G3E family GTPase
MITLHIITGILGSGKTSTLRHLLDVPGTEGSTAIVVGEYAKEGFDATMLRETGAEIVQVTSTGIGEQAKSYLEPVRHLAEDDFIRRIFLETSGVTEIDKVVAELRSDPVIQARVAFGPTLVVMDAGAFRVHDTYFSEQLWGQVDVADTVIVNKTDKAVEESLSEMKGRILERNPTARVLFTYMGQASRTQALAKRDEGFVPRLLSDAWKGGDPADFEAFVYRTRAICFDQVLFGHKLLNLPVGRIARFKGVLRLWNRSICVNGLPGQLDWDNTEVSGSTTIAFIGLDLLEQKDTICQILDDELKRQKDEG